MNEIIERMSGLDDQAMFEYCESLRRVILQTKDVKSGRGKAIETKQILKYDTEQDTIDRIINSCEYYKNQNDVQLQQQSGFDFREYQKDIIKKGAEILSKNRFLYLAMEVRTGKTLTSLGIADTLKACNVLFVTKKKAISSIENDYKLLSPSFLMSVINYESLHLVADNQKWDLIVMDEAHSCFLGDTIVDGKKIKDIVVGDFLKSFNFDKGIYENKKVINVYKNELTENLIKIKCNGKEIVCTESHKIFTKRGWVRAGDVLPEDELQIL
jgi:hypothetical protein